MLDNKDKKILGIIANNSKIPKNQLAKKVQLSREVVDYRLKRLEEKGIILEYQTRLNLCAFSIMGNNLFLKLKYYDEKQEKALVKFLEKQKYTHFIAKVGGNYDYMIGFTIKKIIDLEFYIEDLYDKFNDIILEHDTFTMLEEIKDNVATIFDNKSQENFISIKPITDKPKIDEIDKKIILEIANNSRISSVEIGNKLNLTSSAITYRIKNLEKMSVILGYRTIIDVLKLEKQFYYISFNIHNLNKENKQKVKNEIISNSNIVFANHLSGKYSYVCWLFAENNSDFYEIIKKIQNNLPELTNFTTYTVLEFVYHNYIPNGFLDD